MPTKIVLLGEPDEPGAVRSVEFFDARGRKLGNVPFGYAVPCDFIARYMKTVGDGDGLVKACDWLTPMQIRILKIAADDWIEIREN